MNFLITLDTIIAAVVIGLILIVAVIFGLGFAWDYIKQVFKGKK